MNLNELMDLAFRIDRRLRERVRERQLNRSLSAYRPVSSFHSSPRVVPDPPSTIPAAREEQPEPMQIGRTRLSAEEGERRFRNNLCLYCGGSGHRVSSCPVKDSAVQRGALLSRSLVHSCPPRLLTTVQVHLPNKKLSHLAFIDSGADTEFIDTQLAKDRGLQLRPLQPPAQVKALDNHIIHSWSHRTEPVRISIDNHHESVCFHIIHSPQLPLVLGASWLLRHNPHIDWRSGQILGWSPVCLNSCLRAAPSAPSADRDHGREEPSDWSKVPEAYLDLKEVFNKTKELSLPPHRPYDCAIDLLPGSSPPRGRLYSLSAPERQAMQKYLDEALAVGLFRPSSSPAGAGIFFVGKKDGGLCPCIDYRRLNDITIKNRYPLPLISSAFELLQDAVIFSKFNLRNAYHFVRFREVDEWKTAFITPLGHYEYLVMPFGLTIAPAVFQNLINGVLRDMINKFVFVYLDDILIF